MTESEIKSIVAKYRIRSVIALMCFLFLAIFANSYLLSSDLEHRFELSLPMLSSDNGFIWGSIIVGLNAVLLLVFYSLERILLEMFKQKNSEIENNL